MITNNKQASIHFVHRIIMSTVSDNSICMHLLVSKYGIFSFHGPRSFVHFDSELTLEQQPLRPSKDFLEGRTAHANEEDKGEIRTDESNVQATVYCFCYCCYYSA